MDEQDDTEFFDLDEFFVKLFSEQPTDPNTKKLLSYTDTDNNQDQATFTFEILLQLYIEAILNIDLLKEVMNKHNDFNSKMECLEYPQKWFNSIGYLVRLVEFDVDDMFVKPTDHYCKVILKDNPEDAPFFVIRQILKPYHCLLNGAYVPKPLHNIKAIMYDERNKKMYQIKFGQI